MTSRQWRSATGKSPDLVAEIFQRILKMQRDRIVHLGLDAAVDAVLEQRIALPGEEDVEQVDVFRLGAARRYSNLRNGAKSGVEIGRVLRCALPRYREADARSICRPRPAWSRDASCSQGFPFRRDCAGHDCAASARGGSSSSSLVTTMPASPQTLMIFSGCIENAVASPQVPTRRP